MGKKRRENEGEEGDKTIKRARKVQRAAKVIRGSRMEIRVGRQVGRW